MPHRPTDTTTITDGGRRLAVAAALAAALLGGALAPASAVNVAHGSRVVSDDPVNWTPQVMDGAVKGIVADRRPDRGRG